jgi:hypothetical protein
MKPRAGPCQLFAQVQETGHPLLSFGAFKPRHSEMYPAGDRLRFDP